MGEETPRRQLGCLRRRSGLAFRDTVLRWPPPATAGHHYFDTLRAGAVCSDGRGPSLERGIFELRFARFCAPRPRWKSGPCFGSIIVYPDTSSPNRYEKPKCPCIAGISVHPPKHCQMGHGNSSRSAAVALFRLGLGGFLLPFRSYGDAANSNKAGNRQLCHASHGHVF